MKTPLNYICYSEKSFDIINFFIENNLINKNKIIKNLLHTTTSYEFAEKLLAI